MRRSPWLMLAAARAAERWRPRPPPTSSCAAAASGRARACPRPPRSRSRTGAWPPSAATPTSRPDRTRHARGRPARPAGRARLQRRPRAFPERRLRPPLRRPARREGRGGARAAASASTRARCPRGPGSRKGTGTTRPGPRRPLPTRQVIDAATPDHPVFVQRLDGHMALANSLALRLAGVTRDTPDPDGRHHRARRRRRAHRRPQGQRRWSSSRRAIPEPSREMNLRAARAALAEAARVGRHHHPGQLRRRRPAAPTRTCARAAS